MAWITDLSASPVSTSQIDLAWTNPELYSLNALYKKSDGGWEFYAWVEATAGAGSYSVSGLDAGTLYYFIIYTTLSGGSGVGWSNETSATTLVNLPVAPSGMYCYNDGAQTYISWTNNDTYDLIEIEYNTNGGAFAAWQTLGGSATSENDFLGTLNDTIGYRVRGHNASGYSDYSNYAYTTYWGETTTDTVNVSTQFSDFVTEGGGGGYGDDIVNVVNVSNTVTHALVLAQTFTNTVNVTSVLGGTSTMRTDYGYYFGDETGKVYLFDPAYLADNSTAFTSTWTSRRMDFEDQFPGMGSKWKIIYGVRIKYKDLYNDTPLILSISADGGVTWTDNSRSVGSGATTEKDAEFHFLPLAGQMFIFRIASTSTTTAFQLLGMDIAFDVAGESFEIGAWAS